MFKQASVLDIKRGVINKRSGRIVIVTRFYPRFFRKKLRHEYLPSLAPEKNLLLEFKRAERGSHDHDRAFTMVRYEDRFVLGLDGLFDLLRLSFFARVQDVYLVCHCAVGERCHREILMLLARRWFKAPIDKLNCRYYGIERRYKAEMSRHKVHGHAAKLVSL